MEGSADVVRRTVDEPLLHDAKCSAEQKNSGRRLKTITETGVVMPQNSVLFE